MRDRDEAVLFQVAGNTPGVLDGYCNSFHGRIFHQGPVAPRLKQLARIKLSTMHGRRDPGPVRALAAPDAPVFDDLERAARRLCEQMTLANTDGYLRCRLCDALAAQPDDGQIFELGDAWRR